MSNDLQPGVAAVLANRAAASIKLKHWQEAVIDCTAALECQPGYTKALLRRAEAYLALGKPQEALNVGWGARVGQHWDSAS